MIKFFNNPEIKISSCFLVVTITIFLCVSLIILKFNSISLKEDYSKSLGAIAVMVIEKNPELEKSIIPLITKEISKDEAIKGQALLSEYGLSVNLDASLFPYVNKTILKNYYAFAAIFIFLLIILFTLNYVQYSILYNRIKRLNAGALRVIEGDYDISISENMEGDFSKLGTSFNSMKEVIRFNIEQLKEEKQFLVNLLSDISHQLKTPLSSIILYNDILLTKELPKEQQEEFLINSRNQLTRMSWLIKNILKLAKLDAKAIELNKEDESLAETIRDSIDNIKDKFIDEDIDIYFEPEEVLFHHDRLWLSEALNNIIKNAMEHTATGGAIKISLYENPVFKRIVIEDNGEGISIDDLPNIFKRFYKAKTSKKSDSIGIGLALSKAVIESHDGIIEAQSELNVGTKFIITFLV